MQVREFILKYGIKKIKGLEVIGFDEKETIRVTKQDIFLLKDLKPNQNFRLSTNTGKWIYPDDEIKTAL